MNLRLILAACLALVLVVVLRWQFPDDRGARISPTLPDTRFDYTLTDFSALFRDVEGRVELVISGPRLEHNSATRVATVFEPSFHIDPTGADWEGRADRALLLRQAEETILEGSVVLRHAAAAGPVTIRSERLHHDARARTIESASPVEVRYPGSLVHAGHAVLRLDDDILEFSDHVQGELHPGRSGPGPDAGLGRR